MRHLNAVFHWLAAAIFTLCSGAVWAVLLQVPPRATPWMSPLATVVVPWIALLAPWFALLIALIAVFALRFSKVQLAWPRALTALAYFVLAVLYAQYLRAAVLVAMGIGFGLGPTLMRMGPEMAAALALPRVGLADVIGVVVGALLALLLGYASGRRPLPAAASGDHSPG